MFLTEVADFWVCSFEELDVAGDASFEESGDSKFEELDVAGDWDDSFEESGDSKFEELELACVEEFESSPVDSCETVFAICCRVVPSGRQQIGLYTLADVRKECFELTFLSFDFPTPTA